MMNALGVLAEDPAVDVIDVSDKDLLLSSTQKARLRLVASMTKSNEHLNDPKVMGQVLKALDGIDKQTLTLKKIASDEGVGNRQAQAVEAMVSLFNDPEKLLSIKAAADAAVVPRSGSIEVPDNAEDFTMVEGEMGAIGSVESYQQFMDRMQSTLAGDAVRE